MFAFLLTGGFAFALITSLRLAHNTQIDRITAAGTAGGEMVRPEREPASATGGPYIAAPSVVSTRANAATWAAATSDAAAATPNGTGKDEITATIPADAPSSKAKDGQPGRAAKSPQKEASSVGASSEAKAPATTAEKAAAPVRTHRARAPRPVEPSTSSDGIPFNYFLK
jgi:hypothetical protein